MARKKKNPMEATLSIRIPKALETGVEKLARERRTTPAETWRQIGFDAVDRAKALADQTK